MMEGHEWTVSVVGWMVLVNGMRFSCSKQMDVDSGGNTFMGVGVCSQLS